MRQVDATQMDFRRSQEPDAKTRPICCQCFPTVVVALSEAEFDLAEQGHRCQKRIFPLSVSKKREFKIHQTAALREWGSNPHVNSWSYATGRQVGDPAITSKAGRSGPQVHGYGNKRLEGVDQYCPAPYG